MKSKYNIYLSTHIGYSRTDNEDNYAINTVVRELEDKEKNLRAENAPQPLICSVFDGMGGESSGEIASQIAAKTATKLFERIKKNPECNIYEEMKCYVTKCNDRIVQTLSNRGSSRGGTTFVMALLRNGYVYPFSLGDSRMYLYNGKSLTQITTDDTLAMKKYRANIYTLEEAQNSADSHKLTAFLGVDTESDGISPHEYEPFELKKGEKLLLCTDGLNTMCTDEQLCELLSEESKVVSLSLVEKALEKGGKDNVTCIVIERS